MAEFFDPQIGIAIDLLRYSQNIVVLTGAGISTSPPSNIPDFRSPGGLWEQFNPLIYANYNIFLKKPEYYWELERAMYPIFQDAKPNRAHRALIDLERKRKGAFKAIITQNIDNFHHDLGTKIPLIELHGNIYQINCLDCHAKIKRGFILKRLSMGDKVPICPYCGGRIKPNIVLFYEPIGDELLETALKITEQCDLFLVLGSSLSVYPANQLPLVAKKNKNNAKLIFINQTPTGMDKYCTLRLLGDIANILPIIVDQI